MQEFIPVKIELAGNQAYVNRVPLNQKRSPLPVDEPANWLVPQEAHALEP
ncbi:MAG: hypothetical protein JRN19_02570 [Nitrososphaerota archaeon]|nr:hypothetical protein [Nitrososphaerota archaeon]MDG7051318.1 hypothetical protein [Nitrososphaerota archaeon]